MSFPLAYPPPAFYRQIEFTFAISLFRRQSSSFLRFHAGLIWPPPRVPPVDPSFLLLIALWGQDFPGCGSSCRQNFPLDFILRVTMVLPLQSSSPLSINARDAALLSLSALEFAHSGLIFPVFKR